MITAVQFYDVVLFFHILLVVLAFGPTFAYPLFLATAERTDPRGLPGVGRAIIAWDRIAQIMLLGILIAGIYLVATESGLGAAWEFSDFFVSWGFVAVIVIGAALGRLLHAEDEEADRDRRARHRRRRRRSRAALGRVPGAQQGGRAGRARRSGCSRS